MQYDRIMIRFGELSTKGKNKRNFIQQLAENLMHALQAHQQLTYEVKMDHIYIVLHGSDVDPILERIADVSGIQSYSLVARVEPTMEAILEQAHALMQEEEGTTFKVKAKRADKTFPVISDEINRSVASMILKEGNGKLMFIIRMCYSQLPCGSMLAIYIRRAIQEQVDILLASAEK